MFTLRQYILGLNPNLNKKINDDIWIENGIVYINIGENQFKYEHDCYFIKLENGWKNLQGGVPIYEVEDCLDENIFEKIDE